MNNQLPALSENDITRTALGYLKGYYRQRRRTGQTELISDLRGAGGIVADGFLRYPTPGGKHFMATIEATSLESKDEVMFKVQTGLLQWDAAVAGSLGATIVFTVGFIQDNLTVEKITFAGCLGVLALSFTLFNFLFKYLFRKSKRYRYIYAIQQFKQYFANEQWIALAKDVFNIHDESRDEQYDEGEDERPKDDPYFLELVDQCILNGIGLLIIPHQGPPIVKITPSRQDLFKDKRQRIQLFSQEDIARFTQFGNYPDWMKRFNADNVLRFQRQYKYQVAICLIAVLIVSAIFYKEFEENITEIVVDREAYVQKMEALIAKNRNIQETKYFRIDTPYVWPRPIRNDVEGYAINLGLEVEDRDRKTTVIRQYKKGKALDGFLASVDNSDELFVYDCARLYNMNGTSYIIQEGVYAGYQETIQRITELRDQHLICNGLLLECFDELEAGYAIYFGLLYKDLGEAQRALATYQSFVDNGTLTLELRSLSPK
jgi:hypothetical protein